MSTDNHTLITDNAPVNASTFNSPMGELDAAIGDLSSLTSAEKGSLVGAINEMLYGRSNRHIDLDGADVSVLISDAYLQIESMMTQTNLYLPAISDFGVGRMLKLYLTEAYPYSTPPLISLIANSGAGDEIINGSIQYGFKGCLAFRTVASYPGKPGACWLRISTWNFY